MYAHSSQPLRRRGGGESIQVGSSQGELVCSVHCMLSTPRMRSPGLAGHELVQHGGVAGGQRLAGEVAGAHARGQRQRGLQVVGQGQAAAGGNHHLHESARSELRTIPGIRHPHAQLSPSISCCQVQGSAPRSFTTPAPPSPPTLTTHPQHPPTVEDTFWDQVACIAWLVATVVSALDVVSVEVLAGADTVTMPVYPLPADAAWALTMVELALHSWSTRTTVFITTFDRPALVNASLVGGIP